MTRWWALRPGTRVLAVVGLVMLLGRYAGGWRLAFLVGGCFLFILLFGQWDNAMVTLASIVIAVPLGVAGGLLLGLAGYRWPRVEKGSVRIMSQQNSSPSFVIAISGTAGAGKTALVRSVADVLDDAVALHFDDYKPVAKYPTDMAKWVKEGKLVAGRGLLFGPTAPLSKISTRP